MSTKNVREFFTQQSTTGAQDLGLIVLKGAEELGRMVDGHLLRWAADSGNPRETFIIPSECPRFASGDAKAIIRDTVRGKDLFLLVDVGNYSVQYNMFGQMNRMSPDDHFQDLKRVIQAAAGKAQRLSVIMPTLYGARQDRRTHRESLDCAAALQELHAMGVQNVISFDAHDPRVENATPLMSIDNVMPSYQVLKKMIKDLPDLVLDREHFMVVSPDEGGMTRNMYYASVLGVDLGMFYKRRDYSRVINGSNPIVAHEYLGSNVGGRDVFIADDIIASGDSMLDIAYALKKQGARRIYTYATYTNFTGGLAAFDKAVAEGVLDGVFGTNLTYLRPELADRAWFHKVDVSKYIAYFVAALNHNVSVSEIIDPHEKIKALLEKNKK